MLITSITPQKRRKNRMNIFIDGSFAFGLDLEIILKYHLKTDLEINQQEVNEIIKECELISWWNKTLNFLSFRPRTKKEISDYLNAKEAGEQIIQMVLDKLITQKLIDDSQFVDWFVRQRNTFRPKSQKILKLELIQKGVNKNIIEEYFYSHPQTQETEVAWNLLQKKLPVWKNMDKNKQRQKIQGFLMRRGFNWDIVKSVLTRLESKISI